MKHTGVIIKALNAGMFIVRHGETGNTHLAMKGMNKHYWTDLEVGDQVTFKLVKNKRGDTDLCLGVKRVKPVYQVGVSDEELFNTYLESVTDQNKEEVI